MMKRSDPAQGAPEATAKAAPVKRLSSGERRAQILEKSAEFFSEYGLTGQTRALAKASGIAQRLLYRYFPSKSDLLKEVYENSIIAPFKAVWLVQIEDRTKPIEERLNIFYRDYMQTVLTRRWLRLFLYASLDSADIAPNYINSIVTRLLLSIATETAHEQGVTLPDSPEKIRQIAWILHGSLSHLAIRAHIYGAKQQIPIEDVIALHVASFVGGFAAAVKRS